MKARVFRVELAVFTSVLVLLTASAAWATISPSFVVLDRAHVTYDIDRRNENPNFPETTELGLWHRMPNGTSNLLHAVAGRQLSGKLRLTDLGPGSHALVARRTYQEVIVGSNTVTLTLTEDVESVEISLGTQGGGRLLYDETFANLAELTFPRVEIPAGRRLTLQNIANAELGDNSRLDGSLTLTGCGLVHSGTTYGGVTGSGTLVVERCRVDAQFNGPLRARFAGCWGSLGAGGGRGVDDLSQRAEEVIIDGCTGGVGGYARAFTVSGSDFVSGAIRLDGGTQVSVKNNTFGGLWYEGGLEFQIVAPEFLPPIVTGNSFLGPKTVTFVSLVGEPPDLMPLDDNYWGSAIGPDYPGRDRHWLDDQGGYCGHVTNKLTRFKSNGPARVVSTPLEALPSDVWVADMAYGQNAFNSRDDLAPMARMGRDLMICFDLRTNGETIRREFRLEIGDKTYRPYLGDVYEVRRDFYLVSHAMDNHRRTLNFLIPGKEVTGPLVGELHMEDVEHPGAFKQIKDVFCPVRPAFAQKVRVGIISVDVDLIGGNWSVEPTHAHNARNQFMSDLISLTPLAAEDFQFVTLATHTYRGNSYLSRFLGSLSQYGVFRPIANQMSTVFASYNASKPQAQRLNLLLCLLPQGVMSAEGFVHGGAPHIMFTQENMQRGAVHEFGHTLGLYLAKEQYDYAWEDTFKNRVDRKKGARVEGVTAFNPGVSGMSRLSAPFAGRLQHFPYSHSSRRRTYDLMGMETPMWVVPSTLNSMYLALHNFLGERVVLGGSPAPMAAVADAAPVVPADWFPDSHLACFSGLMRRVGTEASGQGLYEIIPDSVLIRNVQRELAEALADDRFSLNELRVHRWIGTDVVQTVPIKWSSRFDGQDQIPFLQFAYVADSSRRYTIWHKGEDRAVMTVQGDVFATIETQLSAVPAAGVIGERLRLNWSAEHVDAFTPEAMPLITHQLYYSTDGQVSWTALGSTRTETGLDVDSKFLLQSDDIAFKVISADPFVVGESVISGFRITTNRAPEVVVLSPWAGAEGLTNTLWTLQARAMDAEDGTLADGVWESSRDGALGRGTSLLDVPLSVGAHTLVYRATDSHGATGSAAVAVVVKAAAGLDLCIRPSSLAITVSMGEDPVATDVGRLQNARLNRIAVACANQGADADVSAELFIRVGAEPERLLAQTRMTNLPPFGTLAVAAECPYEGQSQYSIRATVVDHSGRDPVSANNTCTWQFTNQPPVAVPNTFWGVTNAMMAVLLDGFDPDGDPLSFEIVQEPAQGALYGSGRSRYYRPTNSAVQEDALAYRLGDGRLNSQVVTNRLVLEARPASAPPSIISPSRITAQVGVPFVHQILAVNHPVAFGAASLPAGLSVAPLSGQVSGTPMAPGPYAIMLTASNAAGVDTQHATLEVADTYESWIARHGFSGEQALPGADPDGDDSDNETEFVFCGHPGEHDVVGVRKCDAEDGSFAIEYRQRAGGVGTVGLDGCD